MRLTLEPTDLSPKARRRALQAAELVLANSGLTLSECAQALAAASMPPHVAQTLAAACSAAQEAVDGVGGVATPLQLVLITR